jgi:glutamyl-tRNA synthetase
MFNELFNPENYEWGKINDITEIKEILNNYFNNYYDENDDKDTWFNKVKELTDSIDGFTSNMKEYKDNPDNYKGNVADVSTVIRVAVTSKSNTPDLYEILKLLGKERIMERIKHID